MRVEAIIHSANLLEGSDLEVAQAAFISQIVGIGQPSQAIGPGGGPGVDSESSGVEIRDFPCDLQDRWVGTGRYWDGPGATALAPGVGSVQKLKTSAPVQRAAYQNGQNPGRHAC